MSKKLFVSTHPLVLEKLAALRDERTRSADFHRLMEQIGSLMGYEVLRDVRTRKATVRTPLKTAPAIVVDQPIVFVAILRAGLGMLAGLLKVAPNAAVGHIGLYRDEKTLAPVRYYVRLPQNLRGAFVVLCDPMLATGGSAVEAIGILKKVGAQNVRLLSLLAAQTGIKRVQKAYPDVIIHVAGIDPVLNKSGYIVPGLGDAGDRLFATV